MLRRSNHLTFSLALLAVVGCESQSTGAGDVLVVAEIEISPPGLSLVAGATGLLVATPKTSSGIVVPNRQATWSSDDLGIATVSEDGAVTGVSTGTTSIHATIDGVQGTVTVEVSPRGVATVTVAPPQLTLKVGETGDLIATPRDADGEAISGRQITFSSDNPLIATVSGTGHVTAVATGLTVVTATVEGKSGTANVSVTSLPATQLEFQNQPATGAAGTPIPAVRVEVQNDQGGMVTEGSMPVTMALADNPTGAVLSGTLTVSAVNGVATFNDIRINQAGVGYSLRASSGSLEPALSAAFAIVAGSASRLAIATQPSSSAKSGEPFAVQPTIQIRDAGGNAVAAAGVEITAVLEGSGATLGGTRTATTNAQGLAAFTDLVVSGTAGPYTLLFAAPGLPAVASNSVALHAGAPASLTIEQQPAATTESGVVLVRQPVLQLLDQAGNVIAEPGLAVTAAIQSGGGVLNGSLTVLTGTDGRASFTNLSISGLIGTRVLRFTSGLLPPVTSGPIVVLAGPAAALIITTEPPASSASGAALSPAPVIRMTDAFGNAVDPVQEISIAATIATGTDGGLSGTTSVTTTAGVATFSGLILTGPAGPFTLRFSSGTLTPAVSQTITIGVGPPASLAIVTQPSPTAESGTALGRQPVIQLHDASGSPTSVSGVEVTVTIASGGGTLGGTTTKATDANGRATFTDLVITGTAGQRTLRFGATGLFGVTSDPIDVTAPPPSALQITTQPSTTAVSGVALATQPVLRLENSAGDPVAGATVTATINSGPVGGTLANATAVTDANGAATFAGLAINGDPGPYVLRFASGALSVLSVTVTIDPVPTQLVLTTAPSGTTTSGAALSTQPAVQIADAGGAPVAQGGTPITAEIESGPAGARLDNAGTTTNASGLATFSGLAITGPIGTYVLRFVAGSLASVSSGNIVLSAGAPATVTIPIQPPATAVNGAALSGSTVVQVQDGSGSNAAGVMVTASLASGGGQLSGTLNRATGSDGRATFDDLVLTGETGPYTLRFSVPGGASVVSRAITLAAGPAVSLSIATQPATTAVSGVPLSRQPVVQLRDGSGNAVAQSGIAVTATIASGGGTLGGTTTRTTGANGQASFTDLEITGSPGPRTLRFSATGLTGVTSGTITLGVGNASALTIPVQPPTTAVNNVELSGDVVVRAQDAANNDLEGVSVTVSVASGTGAVQGTLTRTTGADGRATFNDLKLVGTTGSYTLRFAAGALAVVSRAITLAAGDGTQLSITTQPSSSVESGDVLARQPVVQVRDLSGNASAQGGVAVTVSIASGGGTLGGTTTRTTGANGQASFTDLEITGSPGPRTLRFSATGLTGVTSATVNVTAPAATRLLLATQPAATAVNGAALSTQPSVQVADASGGAVDQAGTTITAVIASGPGGASLSNATAVTNGAGRATFSGLAITGLVGTYTLRFQAGSLTPVTSASIALGAGAPQSISITTQPPTNAVSGDQLAGNTVVLVRDGSGNNASGASVTASVASGNGQLQGTVTRTTASNGQATFDNLTLVGPSGNYTLRFSVAGVSVVSRAISLENLEGQILFILTQPPSDADRNRRFDRDPRIEIRDADGDQVDVDGVTVTAELVTISGGGSLEGDTTRQTNNGVVTFGNLRISGTGTYRIRFTSPGRASATSNIIEVHR